MTDIHVSFKTTVPDNATDEEIEEFLKFQLSGGGCSNENPMVDGDLEAEYFSVEFTRV
tara:strand:- start:2432 stop:2605 length:174 start_codon:yes stop_codon:yes gene_type:complete